MATKQAFFNILLLLVEATQLLGLQPAVEESVD